VFFNIVFSLKGELGEFQIYFRKTPLHQQNYLVVLFFLIRLSCWEIWKNIQNKITKLFSVGNTFSIFFYSNGASYCISDFCIYCAIIWIIGLWLNQDPIWKKQYNNNEISNGVSALLVVYCLKGKPNYQKRMLV